MTEQHVAVCSVAGVRKSNEDSAAFLLSPDGSACLLVLADGMGGHACGEVASDLAVRTVVSAFEKYGFADAQALLAEAVRAAHEVVQREAEVDRSREGMGTTLVAAVITRNSLFVGHVGDSRAFQFRLPNVRRLTQDHLYVSEVLGLNESEARSHPKGHVLAQALGIPGGIEPTFNRFEAVPGDRVLLCSDGVHGCLSEPDMARLLDANTLQTAAEQVVSQALENGSRDNCTVVLAAIPA